MADRQYFFSTILRIAEVYFFPLGFSFFFIAFVFTSPAPKAEEADVDKISTVIRVGILPETVIETQSKTNKWSYFLAFLVQSSLRSSESTIKIDFGLLSRVATSRLWSIETLSSAGSRNELATLSHANIIFTISAITTNNTWRAKISVYSADAEQPMLAWNVLSSDFIGLANEVAHSISTKYKHWFTVDVDFYRLLEKHRASIEALAEAYYFLAQGRNHRAIGFAKKAIAEEKNYYLGHVFLGNAYLSVGQLSIAEEHFKQASALQHHGLFLANLAVIYRITGRIQDAINQYQEILKHNPNVAYIYVKIGSAYFFNNDLPLAVEFLKKALEYDPLVPDGHYTLGIAYRHAGHLDLAGDEFERAIHDYPTDVQAYVMLAVIQQLRGHISRSIGTLKHAIKVNPNYGKAHNNLAALYAAIGEHELAWKHVDKAIDSGFTVHPDILKKLPPRQ